MNGNIERKPRKSHNRNQKENSFRKAAKADKTLLQRLSNKVQQRPHLYEGKSYLITCKIMQLMLAPNEQFFVKTHVMNERKSFAKAEYFVIRHSRHIVEINLDNLYTEPEARGTGLGSLALLTGFIVCTQKILADLSLTLTDTVIFTLHDLSRAAGKGTSFYQNLYLNPGRQIFSKAKESLELKHDNESLWNRHHILNQGKQESFSAKYLENFLQHLLPKSRFRILISK